ncbi:MAG: acetyl-CoA C-acetyltransferase [Planctomycetota bacterium]|nr:acetyl-CoA C-acetyltransferase [Planctomycetota bacterium]
MPEVVVVAARRTPIGKFLGAFSTLSAVDLGAAVVRGMLESAGVEAADVEELIFGQARQLGSGPNPARQVAIRSGMSESSPAYTVNKACGSSLKCIDLGRAAICLDGRKVVVVGGMESMTNIPFLLPQMRQGYRLGHAKTLDGNYQDGFTCAILGQPMGNTAENLVDDYGISRQEQDELALLSHHRAEAAQKAGLFTDEIVPVEVTTRKQTVSVDTDEHVRPGVTLENMAKLPPVFRSAAEGGTVHAGNSSGITDAASALLLMTREEAARRGLTPLARVGASSVVGVPPRIMGIGPVPAIQALCEKTGTSLSDYGLIELNEAFAAQAIACYRDLELDTERVNVNGGAIGLGHPIGATGARIVVTLLHEMQRRGTSRGLASLCMSGGMGMALAFDSLD